MQLFGDADGWDIYQDHRLNVSMIKYVKRYEVKGFR